MINKKYFVAPALMIAVFLAVFSPLQVTAITYGFVDSANTFPNTGAFIVRTAAGKIYPICTGTLIAPTVFLTASHCTAYFTDELAPGGLQAFVSFDGQLPFGNLTNSSTNLIPVSHVVTNPAYNRRQNDPGDIGLLIVNSGFTAGITTATLPAAGLLDQLDARNGLRGTTFTAVGYGVQNRSVGGGQPFFQDLNPVPRMFSHSSFDALNPAWLRLSQNPATGDGGTCYGDSGGPNFMNVNGTRTLVATTVTGDTACRATNVVYRLDTSAARTFLGQYVSLP